MTPSTRTIGLLFTLALFLSACAGGLSKQARSQVTYFDSFRQLQQQSEKYHGETVMLGGKILVAQVETGATELEGGGGGGGGGGGVLQLDIGSGTRPVDNDNSQGRFLVRSDQFLDPAIYPQGTLITVVGHLKGSESRNIGDMPYRYPVIDVLEIKKWPANANSSPRFHFGFGVGTRF